MECKIVIQSHKRWDKVLTKTAFSDAIICVAESQAELYRTHNPEMEIVTHPDNVIGLPAKKNWMYSHFGDLWMADDDIPAIRDYSQPACGTTILLEPMEATNLVQEMFYVAKDLGIYLFGFGNAPVPMYSDPFEPITLTSKVTGGSYGLRKGSGLYWNENMKTGEDHWISCLNAHKHRKSLVYNLYYSQQKDTFNARGGLAEFRNTDTEKETFVTLKKAFGKVVQRKTGKYTRSSKKNPWSRTITFPF